MHRKLEEKLIWAPKGLSNGHPLSWLGGKINCSGNTVEPASRCWLLCMSFNSFPRVSSWMAKGPTIKFVGRRGHSNNSKGIWCHDSLPRGWRGCLSHFIYREWPNYPLRVVKVITSCYDVECCDWLESWKWRVLKRIRVLNGKK